jgi:hypothetical protein
LSAAIQSPNHHTQMLTNIMMKFEHNITMLVQIIETKALRHKRLIKAQHPFLNGNTNSYFLFFSTNNGLMIRKVLFNKELLCKHANNCIQMLPQLIAYLVFMNAKMEKVRSSSTKSSRKTIVIF